MKENLVTYTHKRVYELKETPYWIEKSGYRFYFSSDYNRIRFKNYYQDRKDSILTRLIAYVPSRKKENLKGLDELTLINLYTEIEKRGFRILNLYTGVETLCQTGIVITVSSNV